jgi:drug/metabolite transporter (DMT)-like permease
VSSSGAAAGLGLSAAACWGGSDFTGGLGARRAPVLLIVTSGQILSLLALLALCLGMHLPVPGWRDLILTAVGGFESALALALFYHALSLGAMGLTATLTGLLTALIPVLFSLVHDGLPTPLACAGLVLGCVAIWMITRTPSEKGVTTPPLALFYAALSGCGFGIQLILFKLANGGGALTAVTSARVAGVAALLLVLLVKPPKAPWRGFWLTGILAGSLDTLGTLFYIQSTRWGRLDVAALVCSLYPAGTILLAALFLREWPTRRQITGMALALTAVAMLSI